MRPAVENAVSDPVPARSTRYMDAQGSNRGYSGSAATEFGGVSAPLADQASPFAEVTFPHLLASSNRSTGHDTKIPG